MASGEMSAAAFTAFLNCFIRCAIRSSRDGAIHYIFMDWRHLHELLGAALPLYSEWKNLLVWNKSNAGQGSFYRSKHELIAVFKSGTGPHINNFRLGAEGRYRRAERARRNAECGTDGSRNIYAHGSGR